MPIVTLNFNTHQTIAELLMSIQMKKVRKFPEYQTKCLIPSICEIYLMYYSDRAEVLEFYNADFYTTELLIFHTERLLSLLITIKLEINKVFRLIHRKLVNFQIS